MIGFPRTQTDDHTELMAAPQPRENPVLRERYDEIALVLEVQNSKRPSSTIDRQVLIAAPAITPTQRTTCHA